MWEYAILGLLWAIQSPYERNEICVCILITKLSILSVGVGLHQGCLLSWILSQFSRTGSCGVAKARRFSNLRASGLLGFQKKQIAHFRWWAVVASSGEFRDLWALFMTNGKMEMDREFGAVSVVMQAL